MKLYKCLRFAFGQAIFHSQNIRQRFQLFQQQRDTVEKVERFTYPSYLKQSTREQIELYEKEHRIPININILHSLAHIEFNAFSSYADTYFRFAKLNPAEVPKLQQSEFAQELAKVALEEAYHFGMLEDRLKQLKHPFGSIPCSQQLTTDIHSSQNSCLDRIVMVSLYKQGIGLDAVGKLINKLVSVGDMKSADILRIIQRDQVGHVNFGVRWFKILCSHNGLDPEGKFRQYLAANRLKIRSINVQKRKKAQFPIEWIPPI